MLVIFFIFNGKITFKSYVLLLLLLISGVNKEKSESSLYMRFVDGLAGFAFLVSRIH